MRFHEFQKHYTDKTDLCASVNMKKQSNNIKCFKMAPKPHQQIKHNIKQGKSVLLKF